MSSGFAGLVNDFEQIFRYRLAGLRGTRILPDAIVNSYEAGGTLEESHTDYPGLTVAQIQRLIVKGANKMRKTAFVDLSQDIHPLTDFKRKTASFMTRMKRSRRPLVLTVNGKAEIVVQDTASYQKILDRLDSLEAVEAIRIGIAAAEQGKVKPAGPALEELGRKLGFHD